MVVYNPACEESTGLWKLWVDRFVTEVHGFCSRLCSARLETSSTEESVCLSTAVVDDRLGMDGVYVSQYIMR